MRIIALSILFFVLLVPIASALGYTVHPSQNIGNDPGSPISGETVHDIDPIPLWLALLLCVLPQLTATPIEALISLKASLYLGYRNVCKKNALDNPARLEIFHFIKENPGVHFREILRTLSLARGTLGYHIHIMEEEGLLRTIQGRGRKHYFTAGSPYPVEEGILITVLRNDSLRRILTHIRGNQGIPLDEIAEGVDLSRATVHADLKYLVKLGIVKKEKKGRYMLYILPENYSHTLMKYVNCCPEPVPIPAEYEG
ncbi:winged helix-turn-helix transcriptional regulator [Methanofollis ethanolicus]|uniref:winged helix-turn-helix transcriptional regulator n=1 Tax=Methanofollis ethanolicus TaxID=488124 RepID=UPI00136589C4|nr:helix-turn-helix domain-containing protein [Methanofollis ethanolicus]